jgi:hypothetical protein
MITILLMSQQDLIQIMQFVDEDSLFQLQKQVTYFQRKVLLYLENKMLQLI